MKLFLFFLYLINTIIKSINNKILKKLDESEDIKYLEYSFKRNLTLNKNIQPEGFFTTYFYNQLYINLKVGSNKIEIPFYFYLQQYPFVLQSSNANESEVKGIYDELKSKTYEQINETTINFNKGDLEEGILSKDIFYLKDNIKSFIKFYLSKKNFKNSHITEGGKLGLKLYPDYEESKESCFIYNLKENNIISYNVFSFKYDSKNMNEDSGKLYIGAYPHLYNRFQFDKNNYIKNNIRKGRYELDWIYFFEEIKIGDNTFDFSKEAYFYTELGFIIGSENFFHYLDNSKIWFEYLNNIKKCHKQLFRINDFESNDIFYRFLYEFTGYYCDKDVDVEKLDLGEISFINKNIEYIFNLTMKDLWIEINGYKYFMIIKTLDLENNWYFGKPFFKRYQLVFDYDNKIIGFYKYINETGKENYEDKKDRPILVYILIIIGLVLIIIGLVFLLIKCYFILPRKKRANELSHDNYDYSDAGINS